MADHNPAADDRGMNEPVLEVRELRKYYPITRGFLQRTVGQVKAVDGVSFSLRRGETLALVGESGCGKTTAGRCVLRAIEPTGGQILFRKDAGGPAVDMMALDANELRSIQRYMGMIFQDPYSSLNPRMTVKEIIGEPFVTRKLVSSNRELESRVADLLRSVRLDPSYMGRYPHAFSGGQRQRIAVARALALKPNLVVADEPVSALDVSVQAQILSLLKELQAELQLTYLFITHNFAVVEHLAHEVAVMYLGRIVERGTVEEVLRQPQHPYTRALLSAIPPPKPAPAGGGSIIRLPGETPSPSKPPAGCHFHPRCALATAECRERYPDERALSATRTVRCHLVR